MARSDLLVSLVKAGSSGDSARARSVAEAIIAEERVKRHNVAGGSPDRGDERQRQQFRSRRPSLLPTSNTASS